MSESGSASHWKLVSFLLAGILIPLAASAMPWLLDNVFNKNSLKYTYQGPITIPGATAYSIVVENSGRKTEEDIEIWLPLREGIYFEDELQKNGETKLIQKPVKVVTQTSIPILSSEQKAGERVFKLKSLRPNENIEITVFTIGGMDFLSKYQLEKLRVTSTDTIGVSAQPDDAIILLYKAAFWLLISLLVLGVLWGFYYENLMSREKKEKYLLEQIDKLK